MKNMKKFRRASFFLLAALLLNLTGCNAREEGAADTPETVTEIPSEPAAETRPSAKNWSEDPDYRLTKIDMTIPPDSELAENFDERIYPLPSGDFVYVESMQWIYKYQKDVSYEIPASFNLIFPDGSKMEKRPWFNKITMVLGFDTGDVLLNYTGASGTEGLYRNGERVEADQTEFFLGHPVYENRYFAVAAYSDAIDYFVDDRTWTFDAKIGSPQYALYRYEEQLTPYQYYDIHRTSDGYFLGVYAGYRTDVIDEDGTVLRTEEGDTTGNYMLAENVVPSDPYEKVLDRETGLYYYVDTDGVPLCEPLFNRATDLVNGHAVVAQWDTETNWNRLYMLELTE